MIRSLEELREFVRDELSREAFQSRLIARLSE